MTSDHDLEVEAERLDGINACPLCGSVSGCGCLAEVQAEWIRAQRPADRPLDPGGHLARMRPRDIWADPAASRERLRESDKIRAMIDSGLAGDAEDARAQLEDMGELDD